MPERILSRKSVIMFGQGTILEASIPYIGRRWRWLPGQQLSCAYTPESLKLLQVVLANWEGAGGRGGRGGEGGGTYTLVDDVADCTYNIARTDLDSLFIPHKFTRSLIPSKRRCPPPIATNYCHAYSGWSSGFHPCRVIAASPSKMVVITASYG
jgi:hypothetical protein